MLRVGRDQDVSADVHTGACAFRERDDRQSIEEVVEDLFALVRGLLERHRELTGSPRAAWIFENWETTRLNFIKVFPHEYKRVLGVERAEKIYSSPITPSPLVGATSEVNNG